MSGRVKLFSTLLLLVVAAFFMYAFWPRHAVTARQKGALSLSEFAAEAEFARKALERFTAKPREFGRFWDAHGDLYLNACAELKSAGITEPQAVAAWRRGGDAHALTVEFAAANGAVVLVDLRRNGADELKVTDVVVSNRELPRQ